MKNQEDVGCDEETIEAYRGFANERRHEIRKAQRLLAKEIPNLRLEEAFQRNNLIYRDVRHVREAILDAENINLIKKKVFDNIDRLTYVSAAVGTNAVVVISVWYPWSQCVYTI
mmetsp:Transcript_255/g.632  ORF Transcript_255/g.632 Transcript_255/m.632 type:complete len:114 (-) Transcript_255:987-1328(-)